MEIVNVREELVNDLDALPNALNKKEIKMRQLEKDLEVGQLNLKIKEASIMKEIEFENKELKDSGEKVVFSNDDKRKFECQKRIKEDYPDLLEVIKNNKNDLKNEEIEYKFLKRKFQSALAKSRLIEVN